MGKGFEHIYGNYKIVINKLSDEDGGGYIALVPTLPGCISDGETQDEALVNVKDAIKCWIDTANELGRDIPVEEEYKTENDFSGKLSIRIPKTLHKQISSQAEIEGCSINQLILMYISMGVGNEYGKKQYHITLNSNNEIPKIEESQKEIWDIFYKDSFANSRLSPISVENIIGD